MGGMLQLTELCTKTGERVMEVLHTKHPDARPLTAESLDTYPDRPPELVPIDITGNTVTEVAGQLYRGAGPGGSELVILQHWLLRFGAASRDLWLIVAELTEWLGNGRPLWAAYRAMMSGQLIALDKQPGVRPVGVGGTWRRLMAKCLIWVTGHEAKDA